ncbi:MAG: ABC transporter permease [Phycisphaerales bacterium]|nr:ABC transporter permease [Phycisphaerales bacterium]
MKRVLGQRPAAVRDGGAGARAPARRSLMLAGILILVIGVVSAVNPAFASLRNLGDLLVQSAPVIIVGCGMTLVVLTGEIDISVGSLLGLLAALMGVFASPQHWGLPTAVVIGLTLAVGTGAGLLNGLLVTVGRVPSIIATLAMLTILRGVTEFIMGGRWITDLPPGIRALGTGGALGVPWCLWVAAAVVGVSVVIARRTPLGLRLYAVGGNAEAAGLARISTARVRIFAFMLLGLLTAVAALVAVPQQSVVESGIGVGFELVVVTAVVVGGTAIRGGTGGIAGTVLAALLLGSIRTALVFLNFGETATYWERGIQGGFILAAVLVDHLVAARQGSGGRFIGAAA